MLIRMSIFNIIFGVLVCMAPVALRADDVECGYFNPAFGLCSTHSHNIGYVDATTNLPANPDKSEDVAQMNHIIALKSTVIAQQLKDQYDALSVIIKRFKTQLEKAVLVSKIEVLTGNTASENSNGSSSGSGANGNVAISGAADCSGFTDVNGIAQCLQPNIQKVINAANSGKISEAKKQLINDLTIAKRWGLCVDGTKVSDPKTCQYTCCTALETTTISKASFGSSKDIIACAQEFSPVISRSAQCLEKINSPYYRGP